MANLLVLLLRNPLRTARFSYSFLAQVLLILLRRILLPHMPYYQSIRQQIQRAYLVSCSLSLPDLVHRLPITSCPDSRAKRVGSGWTGYLIPGTKSLKELSLNTSQNSRCLAIYAHGGGYARGEARMYRNYMERWIQVAAKSDLDLVFLSVEYPLTDEAPYPAQQDAFLAAYQFTIDEGIQPKNVIFMGDSAGGGLSVLSNIHLMQQGQPQPAGSILISPWIDMSLKAHQGGNALVETDYVVNANTMLPLYVEKWLGGRSATSVEVNPLYYKPDQIKGLNPQLIFIGAAEFALQEAKDLATLYREARIKHELVVEWGQLHIYALGSKWIDPAVREKTDGKIIEWMKQCILDSESTNLTIK